MSTENTIVKILITEVSESRVLSKDTVVNKSCVLGQLRLMLPTGVWASKSVGFVADVSKTEYNGVYAKDIPSSVRENVMSALRVLDCSYDLVGRVYVITGENIEETDDLLKESRA